MLAGVVAARNTAIPGEFARRRLARVRTPPLLLTEVRRAGHTAGRSSFKLYDRTQRLGKLTDIVVRRIAQTVPCHCAFGTRQPSARLTSVRAYADSPVGPVDTCRRAARSVGPRCRPVSPLSRIVRRLSEAPGTGYVAARRCRCSYLSHGYAPRASGRCRRANRLCCKTSAFRFQHHLPVLPRHDSRVEALGGLTWSIGKRASASDLT